MHSFAIEIETEIEIAVSPLELFRSSFATDG
jgi:hypothetical protein